MGQALYRKYRSKSFSEVIGQDPITETLQKAIKSGRISHAYLLAGPRGVGKTSIARILAHEVNGLPYKDESIHLDIIEIDAASNRRIDEIRDIREKVHIAPTSARYKVYIIDEVHMLTKEAFNALLKTLEEPPTHVIFILATTEAHKLPQTIISRTQRFNFKPVDEDVTAGHLKAIARKEKIDIEPAALKLLAEHSEGSIRDAISMLDQLASASYPVSQDDARALLGLPPERSISKLIGLVQDGDSANILDLLMKLKESGNSPAHIAADLGKRLRGQIIAKQAGDNKWRTELLKNLLDVSWANQPYEVLEISLLEAAMAAGPSRPGPSPEPTPQLAQTEPKMDEEPPEEIHEPKVAVRKPKGGSFSLDLWPNVLSEVKIRAASVYTALRLAEPRLDGSVLTLTLPFPLHKKKLEQSRHIKLISDVIEQLSGANLEIKCRLAEKPARANAGGDKAVAKPASPPELATISNIFGSAEVLE